MFLVYPTISKPLSITDTATKFSAATIIDSHGINYEQSTEGISLAVEIRRSEGYIWRDG